MRRALTGLESGVLGFDDPDGPDGLFSGDLFSDDFAVVVVDVDFGRFLGGLVLEADVAGFSLGREVRNAPRTSSSSCGGGTPTAITAEIRTKPKRIALNRITESPYREAV
jgi:hypothetical protein